MPPSSDAAARALRRAKPLFCPLKTEYYEAFERGEKVSELRRVGGQWNETVCFVGREIILSKGYGKKNRMKMQIVATMTFSSGHILPETHQAALKACYGDIDQPFIEIFVAKPLVLL